MSGLRFEDTVRLHGAVAENILSLSFGNVFTREQDRQLSERYIPEVIMRKRGRRNQQEQGRAQARSFQPLRCRHRAIKSDITALEHQGLNRCLDKGLPVYKRYVALGVLAYTRSRRQTARRNAPNQGDTEPW